MYTLAHRAPWLLRLMFAKFVHDVRRDPTAIFPMMKDLGPADQEILGREDFRQMSARNAAEAFRQGGRGQAHDYTLEARPWGVPLGQIQVPLAIWHGEDDRLVSPQAWLCTLARPGGPVRALAARHGAVYPLPRCRLFAIAVQASVTWRAVRPATAASARQLLPVRND